MLPPVKEQQVEYLVLARKCRPQDFDEVVGQDHVVRTLSNAIHQGRVAHAFIFSGPRGVGKTTVARILAKALNCYKGPAEIPCNECTNCREITEGIAMDVREIDGASNRGIDEIRELRENVKFSPLASRYKLYIIDEVHMLTREAFNALLKTLEEPPAHVIFVFATTEIQKIPATILSRCQCFEFRRISLKQIKDNLRHISEKEGVKLSEKGLTWVAEAGDGSLRDAQSILDQIISYAGFEIRDQDVEEILGLTDRRFLFRLSKAVFERNAGLCLKIIEEGYYAGLDIKYFYQMLIGHFRNLLLTKIVGKDHELLDLGNEDMASLAMQTEGVPQGAIQRLLDLLMAEEENVRRSQNPRINLETVLVRMAYLEPVIPIDKWLSRMEGLEKRLSSGGTVQAKPATYESGETQAVPSQEQELFKVAQSGMVDEVHSGYDMAEGKTKEGIWEDLKGFVKKESYPLFSKIEPGVFLGYKNRRLSIGFHEGYIFLDDITEKAQKERLTEIAKAYFGDDVTVIIESLNTDEYSRHDKNHNSVKNSNKNNDARRDVLNHPLLQKVLDVFDGAVVREVTTRGSTDDSVKS
ncbi:MAG TPA: DNA polymerase III subunit gamma/tau [Syntrophales bacterium]|nr:DNA polymerase III subunit gamma/tau [Syntrophales bacterium]